MVDKTLAGNGDLGSFTPEQLFAGEAPVRTSRITVKAGLVFAQFEVFAKDANGEAVKLTQAGGGAIADNAWGIFPHAIDTSATGYNAAADAPYYEGGVFNHQALVWPAAYDTLAERKAAFARGNNLITVERVL